MKDSDLAERLEQLERRVESLEHHLSVRLERLEEELCRLKERVTYLPVSEKSPNLLGDIQAATQELLVLETESEKQGG